MNWKEEMRGSCRGSSKVRDNWGGGKGSHRKQLQVKQTTFRGHPTETCPCSDRLEAYGVAFDTRISGKTEQDASARFEERLINLEVLRAERFAPLPQIARLAERSSNLAEKNMAELSSFQSFQDLQVSRSLARVNVIPPRIYQPPGLHQRVYPA